VALPLRRSLFPAAAENTSEIHRDVTNRVSRAAPCSARGGPSCILRVAIQKAFPHKQERPTTISTPPHSALRSTATPGCLPAAGGCAFALYSLRPVLATAVEFLGAELVSACLPEAGPLFAVAFPWERQSPDWRLRLRP
jgi:hypothetical protein